MVPGRSTVGQRRVVGSLDCQTGAAWVELLWLEIKNKGTALAKNVRARFEVTGARDFVPSMINSDLTRQLNSRKSWPYNPREPVYIDMDSEDRWNGPVIVRQRIASIGIGQDEALLRMGFVASFDESTDRKTMLVRYVLDEEGGAWCEGNIRLILEHGDNLEANLQEIANDVNADVSEVLTLPPAQ